MRMFKTGLLAFIVLLLASCAGNDGGAVTTEGPPINCTCGNVQLECTVEDATYIMPGATCSADLGQPVETCIAFPEGGTSCTTNVFNPFVGDETAPEDTDEDLEPGLTCTFTPQPAPENYEGNPDEIYCFECGNGTGGCSEAFRRVYQSNAPVQ